MVQKPATVYVKAGGSQSLWASVERYHATGDERLLRDAQSAAYTQAEWFDALSCFDPNRVAEFGVSSSCVQPCYVEVPDFEVGATYAFSFKMRAPHGTVNRYAINKPFEYRAFVRDGNVFVQHYLRPDYPVLSVPYPANEWVTVTSSVECRASDDRVVRLFLNGREVAHAVVPRPETPNSAHPFFIGRENATALEPFEGQLDDVWGADGLDGVTSLGKNWYICSAPSASPHVSVSFDTRLPPTWSGSYGTATRPAPGP
jgi:Concanavalin A-like lectin/glucanases superfamily